MTRGVRRLLLCAIPVLLATSCADSGTVSTGSPVNQASGSSEAGPGYSRVSSTQTIEDGNAYLDPAPRDVSPKRTPDEARAAVHAAGIPLLDGTSAELQFGAFRSPTEALLGYNGAPTYAFRVSNYACAAVGAGGGESEPSKAQSASPDCHASVLVHAETLEIIAVYETGPIR